MSLLNNEEVEVLRTDPKTTFEEIQTKTGWKQYNLNYNATSKTAIWLKFQIENRSDDTLHNYLYSKNHVTTIFQQNGNAFKKWKDGIFVPLSKDTDKATDFFTELTLAPFQKSQIYVKLKTYHQPRVNSYPTLYSGKGYIKYSRSGNKNQTNTIAFIYFYTISLLTIILFTVVFWLRMSAKLYLYYLGYLFFQLLYGLIILGRTAGPIGNVFQYFPKLAYNLNEPIQFAFIGFYIFFINHLLTIKKYNKSLARVLKYFGYVCFLYAIAYIFSTYYFHDKYLNGLLFSIVRIIILPLNLALFVWILLKVKHPLLIFFILGQSFFFIAAALASYVGSSAFHYDSESIVAFTEAPNIIFQIGLLIEVYCFSLALGHNVFLLQKEKEDTSYRLIVQLRENQTLQETMNRELDEKINEKTDELIQLYSEIEMEKEQKIKNDFNQKIRETEMIALRSQMNPHFIFNSLSAIKHLMMTFRKDDAIAYLDDFSSLLRGILQNSNLKKITVEEELEILELYLSLEKNRMGKEFEYNIYFSSREELSQFNIPPLLLQPIVENAIWHGLHPSLKFKKNLTIIFETSEDLKIIIEDNGIGRKESSKKKKLHNSMGSTIVQDRLTLYNHLNDHSIHLKTTDLEEDENALGTRITLTYQY
ncbi:histidine kinase [Aequorivita sublithincola]|uniref:histidine kinase n=1 Tax=Aequorivita sublithincola TaxID=101385 RepID=UPI001FDF0F91|nr:histidine kinase [Aequorivita sublithincola]